MVAIDKAPVAPPWLAARRKPHCLLCGRPSAFVTLYLPGQDTPVAPPPGKRRLIIYSLCEHCACRLDVLAETIEARIESELRHAGCL